MPSVILVCVPILMQREIMVPCNDTSPQNSNVNKSSRKDMKTTHILSLWGNP